jgi:hypothetical protein
MNPLGSPISPGAHYRAFLATEWWLETWLRFRVRNAANENRRLIDAGWNVPFDPVRAEFEEGCG